MKKSLNLALTLVAVSVISAMPTGYRRAGFSLEKGDNSLDVNEAQYKALEGDKNLTVTLVDADSIESEGNLYQQSPDFFVKENESLKNEIAELIAKVAEQQSDINELEAQLKSALAAGSEPSVNVGEIGKVFEVHGLNLLDAPVELNEIIAAIHLMNTQEPLTQKPNCDQFGELKVSAAQRDEAWAWYQENVVHTELIDSEKPESE